MLELCPQNHTKVDAVSFEAAARAGDIDALDAYRGELLSGDRYALWAEEPRERLRALRLRLLKTSRQWDLVLEVDPADEQAHRAIMQHAIDTGPRAAAVRQFERLRERLRVDLEGLSSPGRHIREPVRASAVPRRAGTANTG